MAQSDTDPSAQRRTETKEARLNNPSGWLYLTQHESIPVLIDALLDWPTDREFTVEEFTDHAGEVRQTVSKHLDVLLDVRLIEEFLRPTRSDTGSATVP
jgi:DNA-binding transcriptional ArsR family regulator